jgi:endonuclease YncB( thermonuclease family)
MITGMIIGFIAYWFFNRTKQTVAAQKIKSLSSSYPQGPDGYYPIKINKVKDGDTVLADFIKLPWNCGLINVSVRLYGYDAYEISKKRHSVKVTDTEVAKGIKAKNALQELVKKARWAYLRPESTEIDCYGRILGSLFLQIPGEDELVNVSEWMVSNFHNRK